MSLPTNKRQRDILEWLKAENDLSIDQLCQRLGVSLMTVHRDLDALANMNLVRKFHGGVTLAEQGASLVPTCRMCQMSVPDRTSISVHTHNGDQYFACCPHCGLLLLAHTEGVMSALARDFLYGRAVNVFQAGFVMGSAVALCCEPSVLCFRNIDEAKQFSIGFGGQALPYAEALTLVRSDHSHH